MPLEFGRIVLVPFPFTNQSGQKRRPAVVVSSNRYHEAKRDVIIMAVTSQIKATMGEVSIEGWEEAGLAKPSVVKPVIATIERSLVLNELGVLNASDVAALRRAITQMLG